MINRHARLCSRTDAVVDRASRRITLREVTDDNWRAVADVAPLDEQRKYVAALAARYLLLSARDDEPPCGPSHLSDSSNEEAPL